MRPVVGLLERAAAFGLRDGPSHRLRHGVRVHDHGAVDVARGAPHRLDEGGLAPEEALLVGVEDRDEGDLGEVEPLAQQVDPDQDVELAEAQVAKDLYPLEGVDVGVQVAHADPELEQVVGQVLRHLLRERRDQHPLASLGPQADLGEEVVDLATGRADGHRGVHQAGRAHDLLDHLRRLGELVGPGGRREEDALVDAFVELLEAERAVVERGGEPEAVLDERLLPRPVPLVLAVELGHGHVALVDDEEEVLREVVQQRVRRLARGAPVDVAAVVLDPVAAAHLREHLEVVLGAHAETLRLEQLPVRLEEGEPLGELCLDPGDRAPHALVSRDVVRRWEHDELLELAQVLTRERVDAEDPLHLVAEELDAHRELLVGRLDLDRVAAHAEVAPAEDEVVPLVVDLHESREDGTLLVTLTRPQHEQPLGVLLGRAQPVDARDRCHHDHVAASEQRRGRRVAKPVDLVVDARVLLDVGVRGGHVRLWLVVVVVRDEVLDSVRRKELAQLVGELCRQALVRCDHERRALGGLDRPGCRRRLPTPGDPEERLEAVAPLEPSRERRDRTGLVTRWLVRRVDAELAHADSLGRCDGR